MRSARLQADRIFAFNYIVNYAVIVTLTDKPPPASVIVNV